MAGAAAPLPFYMDFLFCKNFRMAGCLGYLPDAPLV